MNAIELIKDDHKKVKGLFREYEAAGDRAHAKKQKIADQALIELFIHAKIEEEIFYPAVQAKGTKEEKELVAEGIEEHHVVEMLMKELTELTTKDDTFDAKFKVLVENVEHHIEEEEGEMLPDAAKKLGNEVDRLGEEMLALKQQLQQQMAAR
jgi:hemerythrin-like domain-containing protein